MNDWQIFLWAALHSPEFQYCYIKAPISLGCKWRRNYPGYVLAFGVNFQPLEIYIPWKVKAAYSVAHGGELYDHFDDIPF